MKKALITGCNGFVGPHLRTELQQNGYTVYGFDRIAGPDSLLVDITKAEEAAQAVQDVKPDLIFHLAGVSSPTWAEQNPEITLQVNVNGTENLLSAAQQLTNSVKILLVSSSHVYGRPEYLPIDEKHPLNGRGVYARSRLAQEAVVEKYDELLPIVVARSFNHTGIGQSENFVVAKIVRHIAEIKKGKRQKLEIGDIAIKRDISDVRDVAQAYRLLAEQPVSGIKCNVCKGQSISLRDIIEYLKDISDLTDLQIVVNNDFIRPDDPPEIYGDNSLLGKLTGWQARFTPQQTLEDMFNYYFSNL